MIGSRARHSLAQFLELQEPVVSIVLFSKYGVQHLSLAHGQLLFGLLRLVRDLDDRTLMQVLAEIVATLAQRIVLEGYQGSPLHVSADAQDNLEQHAPDVAESAAAVGMRKVRQAWAERLPENSEALALFAELLAMPQSELLSLLAVFVGYMVSAVTSREGQQPAAMLAHAVGLNMGEWWTPTAAGYFDHVSKAKALEAVRVFAPAEVNRLAKLKKPQIAAEAERLAAGSGWLPTMFRKAEAAQTEAAPDVSPSASEGEHVPEAHAVNEAA